MNLMTSNIDYDLSSGRASEETIVRYLIVQHYTGLHRLAANMLNDADAAEDTVQKTILKAVRLIDQYEPHTNFKAWVYRIALNEVRSTLAKRKRRQRMQTLLRRKWRNVHTPSPELLQMQDEGQQRLWDAVQQLQEKHRLPIILRYLEDLSPAEIAQILDVPVGTIYSRLHYAHNKLFGLLTVEEVAT